MSPKRPTIIAVLGLALLLLTGCVGLNQNHSQDVVAAIDHLSRVIAWGILWLCFWLVVSR